MLVAVYEWIGGGGVGFVGLDCVEQSRHIDR